MRTIHCPFCQHAMQEDGSLAGQAAVCGKCRGQFVVPFVVARPGIGTVRRPVARTGRKKKKVDQTAMMLAIGFGVAFIVIVLVVIVSQSTTGPQASGEPAAAGNAADIPLAVVFTPILLAVYFAPTIIAVIRGVRSIQSLAVVNAFLGWTFIGWVVSLAWSFAPVDRK